MVNKLWLTSGFTTPSDFLSQRYLINSSASFNSEVFISLSKGVSKKAYVKRRQRNRPSMFQGSQKITVAISVCSLQLTI